MPNIACILILFKVLDTLGYEANPTPLQRVGRDKLYLTSHLGASTPEAQKRTALDAVAGIRAFFETLQIQDGVNVSPHIRLPSVRSLLPGTMNDLFVLHKNTPGAEAGISKTMAELGISIDGLSLETHGRFGKRTPFGAAVYRSRERITPEILQALGNQEHVLRAWLRNYTQ